jgi:hypothetical protein
MRPRIVATLAAALWLGGIAVACADKIDGAWCRESGERLSIDGPAIVTPAGTATNGQYSRHFFSYVVPPGEPDAGVTVQMRLLNEETMQSRTGQDAPVLTWHRCTPAVSWGERDIEAGQRIWHLGFSARMQPWSLQNGWTLTFVRVT